jgi:hypothetical protein
MIELVEKRLLWPGQVTACAKVPLLAGEAFRRVIDAAVDGGLRVAALFADAPSPPNPSPRRKARLKCTPRSPTVVIQCCALG